MTSSLATGEFQKAHMNSPEALYTVDFRSNQNSQNAVFKLLNRLSETLETWIMRDRQRRQLAELDLRLLDDLGITPSQVSLEISKPFWKS